MPAQVMEVVKAEKHPHADSLYVYSFTSPTVETLQIVANSENIYKVGDLANVVHVNSVLKDGIRIKKATLRGVDSYGMALGFASEGAKSGDDITNEVCLAPSDMKFQHISWPSIENLYNVVRNVGKMQNDIYFQDLPKRIKYRLKVKLDGTNAAVQVNSDKNMAVQSRTRLISTDQDNLGFAKFVDERQDYFKSINTDRNMTVFGEFCGQGIQKRTAISQIDKKILAVFAIQYGSGADGLPIELEIEPEAIRKALPEHEDIYILPWYGRDLTFNYMDKASIEPHAEEINNIVAEVERCDPWVKDVFGVEGIGEGVVAYPCADNDGRVTREFYDMFVFKAKGEVHKVVNTKKPAQLEPEFVGELVDFVNLFITEARLEQGVSVACDGTYDMKRMGDFLKWIGTDVHKESEAELEKSGLKWKQVSNAVTTKAREWYKDKAMKLL